MPGSFLFVAAAARHSARSCSRAGGAAHARLRMAASVVPPVLGLCEKRVAPNSAGRATTPLGNDAGQEGPPSGRTSSPARAAAHKLVSRPNSQALHATIAQSAKAGARIFPMRLAWHARRASLSLLTTTRAMKAGSASVGAGETLGGAPSRGRARAHRGLWHRCGLGLGIVALRIRFVAHSSHSAFVRAFAQAFLAHTPPATPDAMRRARRAPPAPVTACGHHGGHTAPA